MVDNKVPQIRFKGFEEDISSRKLEDVVLSNTYGPRFNANDYDLNGNVKTIRGTDITISGDILYNQVPLANLDTNLIKSHILGDGDLVMITTADCGLTGIFEDQNDKYICSAYAIKISLNKRLVFPQYFKYFFQTTFAKNEVNKLIRKATVANLPASDVLKLTHKLPSKKEQEKIALFLTSLYKLIEQKEMKHQKLKQFKKAMLDKMFPKNGANVPEIRFDGFSGEWKYKKFGECVLIQRGGSPRPIENYITNNKNGINWIKIGDVSTESRYVTHTKQKIIPEGEKNSRKVLKGDLILSNSMSFGRPYIMAIDGCIHDGWLLIRDERHIFNLEYLLQLLSSDYMLNQYKALASGGVVINLNSELVQSTNVFVPDIKEQTKIGNYFQKLDKQIELQNKEIQKLKNIKKASLDKMFV